ncbi:MAG: DUF6285 domain-containing protein [Betaproteobacteria bacterium]|jgi:hypothetical protein
MTDIPDAAELLDTARDALLAEIVPGLSKEARYTALMIANAMAIATREARRGRDVASGEREALRALLASAGRDAASVGTLPELREALRHAIRDGAFDAPRRAPQITAALLRVTADWVAVSNPKALRDASSEAETSVDKG